MVKTKKSTPKAVKSKSQEKREKIQSEAVAQPAVDPSQHVMNGEACSFCGVGADCPVNGPAKQVQTVV